MRRRLKALLRPLLPRRPKPAILMYHRVADLPVDPWGLAVSPQHFDEQMAYLRARRTPLAMDDFVARLDAGTLPADAVAITFDDGYRDNLRNAQPILARHGLTATLFLVTGRIDAPEPFWWDELARLILGCRPAIDMAITIDGCECRLRWDTASAPSPWRAGEPAADGRQSAFLTVWRALKEASAAERSRGLDTLRALLGPIDATADLPMDRSELDEMIAAGIFDLGAHSVSHAALTTLDAQALRREIADSRRDCAHLTGKPTTGFAYPYGDMDENVRAEAAASGFAWACSTESGPVLRGVDRFALPRIAIGDWGRRRFAKAIT